MKKISLFYVLLVPFLIQFHAQTLAIELFSVNYNDDNIQVKVLRQTVYDEKSAKQQEILDKLMEAKIAELDKKIVQTKEAALQETRNLLKKMRNLS